MTPHDIIRAWCASMGYPAPKPGDCIALEAAMRKVLATGEAAS